jgi:hypothetical protein|tara:strand:- start:299 stop:484 length:186 start_codon:yes stop_codon:yes gene_type:complete
MRHLKYEDEKVVAIESYIKDLQRDIDDLEWDGEQYKADKLKILLKEVEEYRDRGEVWYPMF